MAWLGLVHVVRPLPFIRWGDLHTLCHSSLICFTFFLFILLVHAFLRRSMEPVFTPLQGFAANRGCMGVLSFSCHAALPCASCGFSAWADSYVVCVDPVRMLDYICAGIHMTFTTSSLIHLTLHVCSFLLLSGHVLLLVRTLWHNRIIRDFVCFVCVFSGACKSLIG